MAQLGFVYERYASDALKKYDIVPATFTPAGAGAEFQGVEAGAEARVKAGAFIGTLQAAYTDFHYLRIYLLQTGPFLQKANLRGFHM